MKFELYSKTTAPEAAQPILEQAEKTFGAVPNLFAVFAASPATLKAYASLAEAVASLSILSPIEQQVVYLTVSAENGCTYCVGVHSVLADMAQMPEPILTELREQRPLSDPRLDALRGFTLSVMEHRGWVPEEDLADFQAAGFDQRHVLEVITILAQKTLSNYVNHMAHTPLDETFKSRAWEPKDPSSEMR
ncbi:MAG: carboxymuconolactone decarboxylase family protein [Pseudomonadota bacterium]|nr:carboxymuconolactone decarboxylase family protein [Pseudomonadota bacterium]